MKFACTLTRFIVFIIMLGILSGAIVAIVLVVNNSNKAGAETYSFPETFKIGAASASYQIEGGWDADGKSPSIWDTLTHDKPELITDHSNGDVAANSYNLWREDVKAVKDIGFEVYRFSIAWTRIIPDGTTPNEAGIAYYSNLIDELLANNIEPLVTIFHWDLPQFIQDLGGWTNPLVVDYYIEFVDVLFKNYGSRVQRWITFNEPSVFCGEGYGWASKAPVIRSPGVGDYLCGHHVLIAHAKAYHLYQDKYFNEFKGEVGICLNSGYSYPYDETVDQKYVDISLDFELGKFSNAIFTEEGGYPQIMIDQIGNKSLREGRPWSRLPTMDADLKKYIAGTSDFLALNYYTSRKIKPRTEDNTEVSWYGDTNIDGFVDPSWPQAKSKWLYSIPSGLHDLLKWIKNKYDNPTVLITENGWSDDGEIEDDGRIVYLKAHLASVSKAIDDGCNVVAYTVWSLIDNFEWMEGYEEKFGIYGINMTSDKKERIPKKSVDFFKDLMDKRSFEY